MGGVHGPAWTDTGGHLFQDRAWTDTVVHFFNRRSSEIQGTALGKCLRAWTCIYRSMPAGVVQSRHAFVGEDDEYP